MTRPIHPRARAIPLRQGLEDFVTACCGVVLLSGLLAVIYLLCVGAGWEMR